MPFDLPAPAPKPGSVTSRLRAAAAPAPRYLDGLNPEQREAVETLDGPVLVLAGAGTGKTRVLTTRIVHILTLGRAFPSQILAVTFTNKAAREMKHRIGAMVGEAVEGMPWLGTFHAIGVRMLRRHAELVGLKSGFTILDTDDQIRLLKQLLQAEGIDEKRWPARLLANTIDGWKNRGLSPGQVPAGEGASFANGRGQKLYADYQARLKTLNAVDFGDLLLECIRLLRENPDVLADYHRRFRYILVDEYQDTNVAQYLWLRLLAKGSSNVCCVGDDDQSIYGWRGAEVDNILRFESDFPGAKVIRLERNYRSTGHILGAAAHLIAHNEGRLGKTLFSEGAAGEKVTVTGAWDSQEEARAIGEEIEQLQRRGHALSQVAILVRASFQMREFEDRFVTLGLNYRVIGGPRFYERAEIRDALAYLRCVVSTADDLAFERILNVPKRGLGDAAVRQLHEEARAAGVPLQEAAGLLGTDERAKPKVRTAYRDLAANLARWRGQLDHMPHAELAEIVLDESGYTEMWQKDRSADAAGRLENLKELVRSMEPFENLVGFLEHISLVMDVEGAAGEDAVNIMTLHSAKGLEFDAVFLPGWEEGLFPHQRALDEQGRAGLEEERRLAYVGLTRARRLAKIFSSSNRRIHGLWQSSVPSRFLDELPEPHLEVTESRGGQGWGGSASGRYGYGPSRFDTAQAFGSTYATPGWQRAQKAAPAGFTEPAGRFTPAKVVEGQILARSAGEPSSFAAGDRVFHQKFGHGEVTAVEGNKLTVQFDKAGEKRVLDGFVTPG
ncbi:MAG TPA: UvrD-helicase domain-containing protein [Xanthobacteraceae bacterium]|nr:UvrD-helicase domain-containing protein [Xanthobacteraceae bacterium]